MTNNRKSGRLLADADRVTPDALELVSTKSDGRTPLLLS